MFKVVIAGLKPEWHKAAEQMLKDAGLAQNTDVHNSEVRGDFMSEASLSNVAYLQELRLLRQQLPSGALVRVVMPSDG
jgi:hypothetical protein